MEELMRNSIRNRTLLPYGIAAAIILAATCTLKLGDSPIGPPVTNPQQRDTTVVLTVSTLRTQLKADGSDSTVITARLRNINGIALAGDTIELYNYIITAADTSAISSRIAVVTDQTGSVSVMLTSSQVNGTCRVTAVAPRYHDTACVDIVFSGVHISLTSNVANNNNHIRVNDTATVTGQLLDGSNNVIIRGDSMTFIATAGRFADNSDTSRTQIDYTGRASVRLTTPTVGAVTVYALSLGMRDSIAITFDSVSVPPVTSRKFHLYSSKTQLKADNSDTATITATVVDSLGHPATGDSITFTCNIGIIDAFAIVDENGDAKVKLRAQQINGTCIITATDEKTSDTASTAVTFSGITLSLASDVTALSIGDNATVTATLKDGSGNAIGGDAVVFVTKTPGLFENGSTTFRAFLDPTGTASVKVTSDSSGLIAVSATCLNAGDTVNVIFTNNAVSLRSAASLTNNTPRDTLVVGGRDTTLLIDSVSDGSGQPVNNTIVHFYTNAGTILDAIDTTGANGKAYARLISANFSANATVWATCASGTAAHTVVFVAAAIKSIKLTVTPDNISVNGGVATLTATVWDVNDNLVNMADINFRILKSPGGGETIDKPMATTQNGQATAQLLAGSRPSMYRAVLVSASIGPIADTVKLTISGEPYAISVAYPQEDTVQVPNGGHLNPATFDFNMGAVVVDINGNPVADGTRVNFSCIVSGMAVHERKFVKWAGIGSSEEKSAVMTYAVRDVPFEDINNNYKMDENDLTLDYNDAVASRGDDVNGDGRCDFNPDSNDLWIDFNGNGKVDTASVGTPVIDSTPRLDSTIVRVCKDTIIRDTVRITPDTLVLDTTIVICHLVYQKDTVGWIYDTSYTNTFSGCEPYIIVDGVKVWADLYPDGVWNSSELVRDVNGNGRYDAPAGGDRRWWELECLPYWFKQRFDFDHNDFGVAIPTSATTTGGVANVELTYPRQLARRLIVSVNVESNGVRDKSGARFVLPVIVQ
jgi:hypothetical protein